MDNTCAEELHDLRAERKALYAVVRAARGTVEAMPRDYVTSYFPRAERAAWDAMVAALDALPCWCGKPNRDKPNEHAEGCALYET